MNRFLILFVACAAWLLTTAEIMPPR